MQKSQVYQGYVYLEVASSKAAKSSKRTIELREVKLDTKELELQILHID